MFNGLIKVEKIDAEAMIALSGRVQCLGEIISILAFLEGKGEEILFSSWGENLGQIFRDYGLILEDVVKQNYEYIDSALSEGWTKAKESRQRREQGLVDPLLTAEEILTQPYLYTRGGECIETAEMTRREWAEKRAKELNNTLGFKRQTEMSTEEHSARRRRAEAAEREGLGEMVMGHALKVGAARG